MDGAGEARIRPNTPGAQRRLSTGLSTYPRAGDKQCVCQSVPRSLLSFLPLRLHPLEERPPGAIISRKGVLPIAVSCAGERGRAAAREVFGMAVEKLLPQNVEAEAGVLGSLLIDPEAIVQVADVLRPEGFYREAHRLIYQAALDLYETGVPADLITLTDELARRGHLDDIGGVSFVSSLANQVPTSKSAKQYAQIVERTAILRRLIHAAGQIASVAYNDPDADDALDEAEKLIFDVSQRASRSEFDSVGDILRDYIDKLDSLHA